MGSSWVAAFFKQIFSKWLFLLSDFCELSLSGTSVEKPAHWLNAPSCPELNVLTQLEQSLLYVRQIAPVRQDLAVERENPMVRGREILNLILEWSWMYLKSCCTTLKHIELSCTYPRHVSLKSNSTASETAKRAEETQFFPHRKMQSVSDYRVPIYTVFQIFPTIFQSISNYNYLQSKNDLDRIDLTVV